jgi:hypothetical protein
VVLGVVLIAMITRPAPEGPEWAEQMGPTGPINLDSLVATDERFALLSGVTDDGVLLWRSEDGATWHYQGVPEGAPTRLATIGNQLLAYDGSEARLLAFLDGSWESRELLVFPDEMRTGQSPGRSGLVTGPSGFVMTSVSGDVWWWDREEFHRVVTNPGWGPGQTVEVPFDSSCRPPTSVSPDVPAMAATDTGFLALVSANPEEPVGIWPVCEPSVWRSDAGGSWSVSEGALGEGAYVYSVAWRDGRFLAVGGHGIGEPAVWSSDDGDEWDLLDELDPGLSVDLITVRTGYAGWVVLGHETDTSNPVGWVSPDGACWSPLPAGVDGDDAAITADHLMLVQRVTYPETWITTGLEDC